MTEQPPAATETGIALVEIGMSTELRTSITDPDDSNELLRTRTWFLWDTGPCVVADVILTRLGYRRASPWTQIAGNTERPAVGCVWTATITAAATIHTEEG